MKRLKGRFGLSNTGRTLKKSGLINTTTRKSGRYQADYGTADEARQRMVGDFEAQNAPVDNEEDK